MMVIQVMVLVYLTKFCKLKMFLLLFFLLGEENSDFHYYIRTDSSTENYIGFSVPCNN